MCLLYSPNWLNSELHYALLPLGSCSQSFAGLHLLPANLLTCWCQSGGRRDSNKWWLVARVPAKKHIQANLRELLCHSNGQEAFLASLCSTKPSGTAQQLFLEAWHLLDRALGP
jgi:hypothetical protein